MIDSYSDREQWNQRARLDRRAPTRKGANASVTPTISPARRALDENGVPGSVPAFIDRALCLQQGDRFIYYVGHLARTADGNKHVAALRDVAYSMMQKGKIVLVQQRAGERGFFYIAVGMMKRAALED